MECNPAGRDVRRAVQLNISSDPGGKRPGGQKQAQSKVHLGVLNPSYSSRIKIVKTKLLTIIALAAIFSAACGTAAAPVPAQATASAPPAVSTQAPAPSGSATKINISGFKFDPATVTVKVGATVTWTNQDAADHTITGDDGSWTSENLANGATFSFTFDKAGTYAYHCAIHSSMKGTVVVE